MAVQEEHELSFAGVAERRIKLNKNTVAKSISDKAMRQSAGPRLSFFHPGTRDAMPQNRSRILLALLFLVAVALLGGASRATALSHLPLRLIALAFLLIGLWRFDSSRVDQIRPLLWLFAGICLLPALQLIPLPYDLWATVPGRSFYANILDELGVAQVWRPLSLTPGLTWNSLLSLLVPLAMLILAVQVPPERQRSLMVAVLALAFVSLVLGHAQLATDPASSLRLYKVNTTDAMIGLFANRNHHALLLALSLPMLVLLAVPRPNSQVAQSLRAPSCAVGLLVVFGTLLVVGSRAGLALGILGLIGGMLIYLRSKQTSSARARSSRTTTTRFPKHYLWLGLGAFLIMIVWAAFQVSDALALQRVLNSDPADERRLVLFPTMLKMAFAMFPFGGGFGSFDQVFRRFEEFDQLQTTYMNHAHVEPLEILAEGGALAMIILVAFLYWWITRSVKAWRKSPMAKPGADLAMLGSLTTGLTLLASLVDYPLRTPLHMTIFVIGCVWLQQGTRGAIVRRGWGSASSSLARPTQRT